MKIGVVSDTHSKELPDQMVEDFKAVDLIFHVGDFCDQGVVTALRKIKDMKGVHGNMDGPDLRKKFPRSQVVEFGGLRIGLFHGEGSPKFLLERVKKEFEGQRLDAIVFGHSHSPMNERIGGVLFFNPGSPTDTVFAPYRSYGVLHITDKIEGEIIKVK